MYTKLIHIILLAILLSITVGCTCSRSTSLVDGLRAKGGYELTDVNAIQQALPTIMVIPSDRLLNDYGALQSTSVNGRVYTIRDYRKYLIKNKSNAAIVSAVQRQFVRVGYSMKDLEQSLRQIDTQEAIDIVDSIRLDSKTLLLTTAAPDIIVELDYFDAVDMSSHDLSHRQLSYSLRAVDTYTGKVVASINESGLTAENTAKTIERSIADNIGEFSGDIQNYFSDILYRGREVKVRFVVCQGSNISLGDICIEEETYSDWILDYVKVNTVKGAYKMELNTNSELSFTNVRIPVLNPDGTQYGVYDWARIFCREIRDKLGVNAVNASQGLGEITIIVKGL